MIKLQTLNKYFNKNKKNEIHVLNQIDLTFDYKGLTVLLGPSGSGKTTLLNVIGGLDKVQSGSILYDETQISKYQSKIWDEIRNRSIGYIFQNYYLLPHETVYENIALTLRMIGITDEEEIDFRIEYVLEKVNMANFKKRLASQLSGGQQQRVAIARALAKNPKVIIADEPTGNLDSKNTLEIMRIIKQISKEKLVILVTHETDIADFYADRVIRLEDGRVVSDLENEAKESLDTSSDSDIYLKDMNQVLNTAYDQGNIELFTDEPVELSIRLVVKNKTLYLDVNQENLKKIHVLDKTSEMKIYNKKREEFKETQEEKDTLDVYDFEQKITTPPYKKTQHVIKFKDAFKMAFKKVASSSKLSKLLYLGFAGGAMVMAFAIAMLANVIIIEDSEVLSMPKETLRVYTRDFSEYNDLVDLKENAPLYDFTLFETTAFNLEFPAYFNVDPTDSFEAHGMPSQYLDENNLMVGSMPGNEYEVVLDKVLVDRLMERQIVNALGFTHYESFLNLTIQGRSEAYNFKVVGISDANTASVYMDEAMLYERSIGDFVVYDAYEDDWVIEAGRAPLESREILLSSHAGTDFKDFTPFTETINRIEYTVVGYAKLENEYTSRPILLLEDVKEVQFERQSIQTPMFLYAEDTEALEEYLDRQLIEYENIFEDAIEETRQNRLASSRGMIIFTIIAISASALSFYFIIRSSMISRIYEIGVYRSLGVSRLDIMKLFVIEAVMLTSLSSLIGFMFMNYILYQIHDVSSDVISILHISPLTVIIGIVLLYAVHVVSSMIPVGFLLRKTPAQINAQYDL